MRRAPESPTLCWHCHPGSEGLQLAWRPSTELFCNVLLTASSCQLWENNQKHRFSTFRRKPKCSSVQTDLEAALPYVLGYWEVFPEQASPCAHMSSLLWPDSIYLTCQIASKTVPLLGEKCNPNCPHHTFKQLKELYLCIRKILT